MGIKRAGLERESQVRPPRQRGEQQETGQIKAYSDFFFFLKSGKDAGLKSWRIAHGSYR
jgi:hypothetical protein